MNCARHWRSPSSINRRAAPPTPTPSSRPRSKASRRRPKCRRSPKRGRCVAALEEMDEVKTEAARRRRMTQLHAAYGNAMILAHGYGARETSAAFERARDTATGAEDGSERLSAQYGLWAGSFVRGELGAMRELSASMLRDCERQPQSGEASIAHRMRGVTHWFAGEFDASRGHLEQATAIFDPERDGDLAFRFGQDPGIVATAYLAEVLWLLGEVGLADQRMKETTARAAKSGHVATSAYGFFMAAQFELFRRNPDRAAPFARSLIEIANEHQLPFWMAYSAWFDGWLEWWSGNRERGLAAMRNSLARQAEQGIVTATTFFETILAEAEAEAGETDVALCTINRALAASERTGLHWYDIETHRIRGEILLRRNSTDTLPAEEAFQRAIAVAREQGARSFQLRAALSLAKLCQSTGRPLDAHAILAPALEGFSPTPEMPEIAEAEALLAALEETDEVKADAARRRRTTHLQADYGAALISARGYGAPETTEAFARARESAPGDTNAPERLVADYGLWAGSYARGELPWMRMHAAAFVRDVEARPDSPEAGIAHRVQAKTHYFAGEYVEAVRELERALALFEPGRDDNLAVRFPPDPGVASMIYLAFASWALGEAGRAVSFVKRMEARMAEFSHAPTLALGRVLEAFFSLMRGDRPRARTSVSELALIVRDHDLPVFRAFGEFLVGWATIDGGALADGLEAMRRGAESLRRQNVVVYDGLVKIALAEAEARAGDPERALKILEEALATCDRMGYRAYECELHRARGELLHERDPDDPVLAEEAFRTAIAIAKQQATRSFELRAALSLAKLYQSAGRPVEAHTVLAPALEGFSPTPEMPEIAEAQTLLAALQNIDEVKADKARRQQRGQLHVAYGNALIAARGFGAPETTEAFARARESALGDKDASERLAADYGLWVGSLVRGELSPMRAYAETFLGDVAARPDSPEAGVAHRAQGITHWFAGEFIEARHHLERALALFQSGRDDDLAFRFGQDAGVAAMLFLALTLWPLGDIGRAVALVGDAEARIAGLPHIGTRAFGRMHAALFALMLGDMSRAASNAAELARLTRDHDLPVWRAFGVFLEGSAGAQSGPAGGGLEDMRRGVELLREQNIPWLDGLLKIPLAEAEARAGNVDHALAILDEALATCDRIGHRTFEAELHRVRGDTLLKRDPANPSLAEAALGRAIEIARGQGTRSFELRAALSLGKLHQATGRPADAHAVLAPALEGFAPTPEMPEIAEALAFVADSEDGAQL